MVHWVYILRCTGEQVDWTSKGINDKIYVGETIRLYTRLREHTRSIIDGVGSCTTSEFYPNRLIGLYKVKDECSIINGYDWGFEDEKLWGRSLENELTEMYMQAMGPKWKNVYGGKYHNGYRPCDNPGEEAEFNRPFCNCKIPADIKEYNGKKYWRCSRKNIWDKLHEYIVDKLGLNLQNIVEPCNFYKEYTEGEKFHCKNLIYNSPTQNFKLTGKCLILDDSDDE